MAFRSFNEWKKGKSAPASNNAPSSTKKSGLMSFGAWKTAQQRNGQASLQTKAKQPPQPPKRGFFGGYDTPKDYMDTTKVGKFLNRVSDVAQNTAAGDRRHVPFIGGEKPNLADTISGFLGTVVGFAVAPPGLVPAQAPATGFGVGAQGGKIIADTAIKKVPQKIAQSKAFPTVAKYGTQALEGGAAFGTYGLAESATNKDTPKETLKNVSEKFVMGAGMDVGGRLAGKAASPVWERFSSLISKIRNRYASGKIEPIEMPKTELPERKDLGALRPKNTALDEAINRYNQAVEAVQNHFGTNQLRANEMARIKTELGIDLDSLLADIEKAEKGVDVRAMGERGRLKRVAGVVDTPKLAQRPTKPLEAQSSALPLQKDVSPAKTTERSNLGTNPFTEYPSSPKERQFAQNVRESQVAPGEVKQNTIDNRLTYEPITNHETLNKATDIVNRDYEGAKNLFSSSSGGVSADDVALGEALITKAIKNGNHSEANILIADLAEKLTTAGQAVQAASMFKRMTPEGMLLYAQRMVNAAQKDQIARMGAKAKKIILTAEDADFILNTMKEAQKLPEGRVKDVEIAKVMQLIANKVPATLSEKAKGLQRISLLLNPKTMIRNLGGNTLFATVDNLSNSVATPIDMLVGKFTGKRTTALPSLRGQFKSGLKGAKETLEDARLGIDTSPGRTQFDLPNKRIFDTNALDKLDRVTRAGLELGDRPFYKAAYDDSLRQQMKLANATEPTQAMIEQAHRMAQQRTYQDVNALTDAFKKAQQALNNASAYMGLSSKEFGLGNIVIPFVKTPANILARAIEYSPVGITRAIQEATKIGKGIFDQKAFVDSLARSVTGTALIMVGYDLAKNGMITGSGNEDKDVAAFERNLGKSDYAFKYGDNYYTYDWAQPASMALAIGADMFLKGRDRKEAGNVVFDAIRSGGETLFKQSVMQGLQRFMGGYSPIDNLESTAINAPTQFVPTLAKQITQLTDPLQRSTYSQSKLGTGARAIASKIPGASRLLEPKVGTSGEEIKNYQGKNNLINIFANPGSSTEFKPNRVQSEIIRLYESTGNKDIFPKIAPKYFMHKGERIDLTPEEITQFQRTMGKKTEARMERVVNELITDQERAKHLSRAIELSYEEAKKELLNNRRGGD